MLLHQKSKQIKTHHNLTKLWRRWRARCNQSGRGGMPTKTAETMFWGSLQMNQHSLQSTSSVSDNSPNLLISRRCCFYALLSFLSFLILRWTSFTRALQFTVITHVGGEVNMLSAYHLNLSICNAAICSAHKIVLIGSNTPVINSETSLSRAVTSSWIQLPGSFCFSYLAHHDY